MQRTSQAELRSLAEQLAGAMGYAYGTQPGEISIDQHSYPSGWRLALNLEHGAEHDILGSRLRPAREMADTMRFALNAMGEAKTQRSRRFVAAP